MQQVKQHGHLVAWSLDPAHGIRRAPRLLDHALASLPHLVEALALRRDGLHIEERVVDEVLGGFRAPESFDGLAVVVHEVQLGEHVP